MTLEDGFHWRNEHDKLDPEGLRWVVVSFDRWAQHGRGRLSLAAWVVPLVCLWASPLLAAPTLRQECKQLSPEDSARVEARLLASLLTRDAADVNVSITCDGGIAVVSASVGPPEVRRSVALSGAVTAEAILGLAERALSQLLATATAEVPPVTPIQPSPAEPGSASAPKAAATPPIPGGDSQADQRPPSTAAAHAQAPAVCATCAGHDSRVRAEIALQSWGSDAAMAVFVGLEQSTRRWTYAFLAGAARPLQQPSLSEVAEWSAAAELGWQGSDALGLRISARVGLSLLTVNPDSGVSTSSGTLKSAGYLELDLSRPIWLGRFGLAPGLGLRAFTAKRAVTIEGQPELQLSTPSAHAFLTVLFRTNE